MESRESIKSMFQVWQQINGDRRLVACFMFYQEALDFKEYSVKRGAIHEKED